jgi:hypothetical protein
MLGDKDRMPSHWRLPTIVLWLSISQPFYYESPSVLQDNFERLFAEVGCILGSEAETATELAV